MNLKNLNIVGLDGFEKLTILQVWMDLKNINTVGLDEFKKFKYCRVGWI